jgi:hypothetical protein
MGDRPRPQKPRRNPSHFVMAKNTPSRRVVEEMPRVKAELELKVAQKFVNTLRRKNIYLDDPRPGVEPADLMCNTPIGQEIGLQLVEVVNEPLRQLQETRSTYQDSLRYALGADLHLFNGCLVSLCDSAKPHLLPKVESKAGQACLRHFTEFLRSVAKDVHTLQVGNIRHRRINTTDPVRSISVTIHRRSPAGESARVTLYWSGGAPSYRVDISRDLLTGTVRSKISKYYAKPTIARFVLLTYSVDTHLEKDDPDVTEAKQLLDTVKHPFDEVWFFVPIAQKDFGQLIKVWPR